MLSCYILKYGRTPFYFLLHGRNFYDERRNWVAENTDSFSEEMSFKVMSYYEKNGH